MVGTLGVGVFVQSFCSYGIFAWSKTRDVLAIRADERYSQSLAFCTITKISLVPLQVYEVPSW